MKNSPWRLIALALIVAPSAHALEGTLTSGEFIGPIVRASRTTSSAGFQMYTPASGPAYQMIWGFYASNYYDSKDYNLLNAALGIILKNPTYLNNNEFRSKDQAIQARVTVVCTEAGWSNFMLTKFANQIACDITGIWLNGAKVLVPSTTLVKTTTTTTTTTTSSTSATITAPTNTSTSIR